MLRYCAEYCPGDADSRYVPAGRSLNSNTPCASVVVVFGRPVNICTLLLAVDCTPFTITVCVVTTVPGAATDEDVSCTGGATGIRFSDARLTGLPVSAATTRPRMIAVPVGSGGGRRTVSRGGCGRRRGGGGGGGRREVGGHGGVGHETGRQPRVSNV